MFKTFALKRKVVKLEKRHELDIERLKRAGELVNYLERTLKENIKRNEQAYEDLAELLKRAYTQLEGCGYSENSPLMEDIRKVLPLILGDQDARN